MYALIAMECLVQCFVTGTGGGESVQWCPSGAKSVSGGAKWILLFNSSMARQCTIESESCEGFPLFS
jgi:hypothetical protein